MSDALPEISDDETFIRILFSLDVRRKTGKVRGQIFKPNDGKVSVVRELYHNLSDCCEIGTKMASDRGTELWGFAKLTVSQLKNHGITKIEHDPNEYCNGHYNLIFEDFAEFENISNPESATIQTNLKNAAEIITKEEVLKI